ncbi:hypothetical protein [Streptomyces fructofermentans]|uniref:Uncharacterized protein n=1 Tax=Streptomyces fructofermentans TaxID=152141 RepID=A0A918NVB3_9ACTN|nr:hypothetical protein [Streptomyces fructofermentans]GGX99075.1 hypothetical protein GCM10010515_76550 [Streptomyces fructofermentans]
MTTHAEDQAAAEVPAEDVPDGTFGRARHRLPAHITPCTPEEQARHHADLDEALSGLAIGPLLHRHPSQGERHDR